MEFDIEILKSFINKQYQDKFNFKYTRVRSDGIILLGYRIEKNIPTMGVTEINYSEYLKRLRDKNIEKILE